MEVEEANKYLDSMKMPSPESLMTDIRDLMFGTRPKSKDVIDKCQKYAKAYHQSQLQALKEEVEELKSYPMVYDSYSGEAQMVDKAAIIELITNLEDNG